MKKQLAWSAITLTIALTGGLGNSAPANACPFARNTTTPTLQNSPNSSFLPALMRNSHSKMLFGIGATVSLLATGWVVASRLSPVAPAPTPEAQPDGVAEPV
jgi:hypothetical protein